MQIEGTKVIFVMNFSVLDFSFASRMPQIAKILVSTFKIFRGSMLPLPPGPGSQWLLMIGYCEL